jgi:nanoRNase/pAp phosphatase (c-di-AMP/oligoRNAs hydrolase)
MAKGRDVSTRLEQLREVAARGERLLIVIYGNPDPDALGSAVALRKLLRRTRESCTIAYTGEIGRPENAAIIRMLRLPVEKFAPPLLEKHSLFAVVDAQPHFFKEHQSLADLRFHIVIDHHPRGKGYSADFEDVRPSYGSTSTILTEYLRQSKVKMTPAIATALYYGLETDTASLQRVATDADIQAFRYLRTRASMGIVRKVQQWHFPLSALDYFATAIQRKRVADDVLFSHLGMIETADICVHVADFFLGIYEIDWAIVSGIADDTLFVVLRSDGYSRHAGRIASGAFGAVGSAGGHKTMARAEIPLSAIKDALSKVTNESVERYLLDALGRRLRPLRRL